MKNLLIQGDNLKGLNFLLKDKNMDRKIDLIYIDQPFATNGSFTITNGRASTISNSKKGDIAYCDKLKGESFVSFLRDRLVLFICILITKCTTKKFNTVYRLKNYI